MTEKTTLRFVETEDGEIISPFGGITIWTTLAEKHGVDFVTEAAEVLPTDGTGNQLLYRFTTAAKYCRYDADATDKGDGVGYISPDKQRLTASIEAVADRKGVKPDTVQRACVWAYDSGEETRIDKFQRDLRELERRLEATD